MESVTCLSSCSVVLRYLVSGAGAIHGKFPVRQRTIMDEKKRQLWRFVIQTAISILTAIATALGVTSCMTGV